MPFACQAKIEPGQLRHAPLIFDHWIEEVWDRFVPTGTAFAVAHDIEGQCTINLNGPGFLSAKPSLEAGDPIQVGSIVAYFSADGESIPYGKPYCVINYT